MRVLPLCGQLILELLLIQGRVTGKVRLLGLYGAIERTLGKTLLRRVVLKAVLVFVVGEAIGKRAVLVIHRLLHRRAAERTARGELSGEITLRFLKLVGDVGVGLVDHPL